MKYLYTVLVVFVVLVAFGGDCQRNKPPNEPSNPSPANGAINQQIDVDLNWTGGDPNANDVVTYDVYFGTISTAPLVSADQEATTYDPGILEYNTAYYWKVIAEDNHGRTAEGPIWNFTTRANNPPYAPSNPSPTNNATNQSIDVDLGWSGGDPDGDAVTYDVYFGTSSPPNIVSDNQQATSYDPGALNYNTKYYWRVVAEDEYGAQTMGDIWNFTTQEEPNNPPYAPSNPSPANNATNQSINVDLSWTGGDSDAGDVVSYDVYFGSTSTPPLVSSNQSTTTYDPGTLQHNTKYYWKIIAEDDHGATTEGSLWNFTTKVNNSPYKPGSPSPANNATNQSIYVDLSWSGGDTDGDAVTYDVYFGTSSPPNIVSDNQTARSYDPGALNYNTKYYWRVVAEDEYGAQTMGDIWNFTTAAAYWAQTQNGTQYDSIFGNHTVPDPDSGSPWIALSSYGTEGAIACWSFYGLEKSLVESLRVLVYCYDDGWGAAGADHHLYNFNTSTWDYLGSTGHELAWWYIKVEGTAIDKYIGSSGKVWTQLKSVWADHTHIKYVRCEEYGEGTKSIVTWRPSNLKKAPFVPDKYQK